jgi:hypothetical protein
MTGGRFSSRTDGKTWTVSDEQKPRPPLGGPEASDTPMGAPPGRDPDYELHEEIGDEAKRLVTHPRDESRRLSQELAKGESEATPLLAISVVGVWVAVVIAIVVALVVVAIYLA